MSILFFFLSFLAVGAFAENTTTVQVTVFYESLCSDSIKFFKDKLIPTYTQTNYSFYNISPNVDIIPFGKANVTDNNISCQHGPYECDGNKLHACAIKYITDKTVLLNYIGCLMNATSPVNISMPYPAPDTCKDIIASADVLSNINSCYKNGEGNTLLINTYGPKTKIFFTNHNISVPFIAFNNAYNETLSKSATDDYRKTLCSQAHLNNNAVCTDSPNGAAMLSASFTLIPALFFFFYATQ